MGLTLSMDMSMRSSGLVVLTEENDLIHFEVIKTKSKDFSLDEDLINSIVDTVINILIKFKEIDKFVIEGLSFGSKSSRKDVLAGIFWSIRSAIRRLDPSILIGSIPVRSWRSHLRTKEEWQWFKDNCRDHLKNAVFTILPDEIQQKFIKYTIDQDIEITSVFDLTDAYWLGLYRNSLKK